MGAKIVVNAVLHAVMVALIEAGAMAAKLGLPLQTLADILKREEGLMRPLTHRVQERIIQGNYAATLWEQWTGARFSAPEPHADRR
jgi:3-hydroxyisobutyrate dehydrogenase-like beta-hydroxyacid dehydrogenase